MKPFALALAGALTIAAGLLSGLGMTGHMAAHMIAVALAAPLLAVALGGGPLDAAARWPRVVAPMPMMLAELVTVWGWHLPALRRLSHMMPLVAGLELVSFLAAGLLLWGAVLHAGNRAAGIGALLLTSMHMTLLGVLVGLAPRPLYGMMDGKIFGLDPLQDQQLGGIVMLIVGGISYLMGGLLLLASVIRTGPDTLA